MNKFNKILKRMASGLDHQNDGDFLSGSEKHRALGFTAESSSTGKRTPASLSAVREPLPRRIAFITNGLGYGRALEYALETCSRQKAEIDLLVHEHADREEIGGLEDRIRLAGISCNIIPLTDNATKRISEYACGNSHLIYFIARPDDPVARMLAEQNLPLRRRLQAPLVMIEDEDIKPAPEKIRRVV